MRLTHTLVNVTFRRIVRILCRVDDSQWHKFPQTGPFIMAANHINFLDAPGLYTHLMPRPITGFVKAENWDKPFTRWLFTLWDGIPLHRGEADMSAVRLGMAALAQNKILTIAPEGHRSGTGILGEGHPGIVVMALKANVPILPVVYYGHEQFWPNFRRLRRTNFYVRVGQAFYLDPRGARIDKVMRQQMIDEIMVRLAVMLPPELRGRYGELDPENTPHLRFVP